MDDTNDAQELLARIADDAGITLDELLAIPPQRFTDKGAWLAFLERLRKERAELQLNRTSSRGSFNPTDTESEDGTDTE